MQDPSKCIILVPFRGAITPECDRSLRALEYMGYRVERVGGYAAIDQGRCQMATDALQQGYQETFWIDSDIAFDPAAVESLRMLDAPIVCGLYPQKGKQSLACHVLPSTRSIEFGRHGGLLELRYAGTGFMLVRRQVYESMHQQLQLPVCNERFARPLIPFFAPMQIPTNPGYWYLAEDYAFCHRARQCGFRIMADTRIRLWHVGTRICGWESPADSPQRFDAFTLTLVEQSGRADIASFNLEPPKGSSSPSGSDPAPASGEMDGSGKLGIPESMSVE